MPRERPSERRASGLGRARGKKQRMKLERVKRTVDGRNEACEERKEDTVLGTFPASAVQLSRDGQRALNNGADNGQSDTFNVFSVCYQFWFGLLEKFK